MGFRIVGLLKIVVWGRNSSVALWREEALIARDEQPSSGSFCATLASYNCDACSSGGRLLAGISAPPLESSTHGFLLVPSVPSHRPASV